MYQALNNFKNKLLATVWFGAIFCIVPLQVLAANGTGPNILDLAEQYYNQGMIQKTDSIATAGISMSQNDTVKGMLHYYLAKSQQQLWQYNKARNNYYQAEQYLKPYPNKSSTLIDIYSKLAGIYTDLGDFGKAREYFLTTRRIINQLPPSKTKHHLSIQLNYEGLYYQAIKEYQNSIKAFTESLELRRQTKMASRYIPIINIAISYLHMQKYDSALHYNFMALEQLKNDGYAPTTIPFAIIYNNIGDNLLLLEDNRSLNYFNEGLNLFKKLLPPNHPYLSTCYLNIGNYHRTHQRYDSALYFYDIAIEKLIRPGTDNNRIVMSISPLDMLDALRYKALTHALKGQAGTCTHSYDTALNLIDKAITLIEKTRNGYRNRESQLHFSANQKDIFNLAAFLTSASYERSNDKKYIFKFYEYSEKAKANVLLLAIRNLEAREFGGLPKKLIEKENEYTRQIAYHKEFIYELEGVPEKSDKLESHIAHLNGLKTKYDSLINYFENNYKRYYQLKYDYNYVSVKSIQKKLDSNTQLLHYHSTDSAVYICVISKNNIQLIGQPVNHTYGSMLTNYYSNLSSFDHTNHSLTDYNNYIRAAHYLYNVLIPPLKKNTNKLIIVPDEYLAQLPFDALLYAPADTTRLRYSQLPYLIRRFACSYSYSATLLFNRQYNPLPKTNNVIAFAPEYPAPTNLSTNQNIAFRYRENLYPIPGAIEEIEQVTHIVNGKKFTGNQATETNFLKHANAYKIIHLAMHTIIDNENPMYSKLAFSHTDSVNDGFLNTHEIYNLNLNAHLTILSACNTGIGKRLKAEGIMSLARGFIYAGCPSVIMTLWRIEDLSSSDLMTLFYKEIKKGQWLSEGLQKAKLRYLKSATPDKTHPYYWASYIKIGENQLIYPSFKWYALGITVFLVIILLWIGRNKLRH